MFTRNAFSAVVLMLVACSTAVAQTNDPFQDYLFDYNVEVRVPERTQFILSWVLRSPRMETTFESFPSKAERTERIAELISLPGNRVVNIQTSKKSLPASQWAVAITTDTFAEAQSAASGFEGLGLETRIIDFKAR